MSTNIRHTVYTRPCHRDTTQFEVILVIRIVAMMVGIFLFVRIPIQAHADDGTMHQFRLEYPQAAAKWKAKLANLQCGGIRTMSDRPTSNFVYSLHEGKTLAEFKYDQGAKSRSGAQQDIACWTHDYSFTLERMRDASPYVLRSIIRHAVGSKEHKQQQFIALLQANVYMFAPIVLFDLPVMNLLDDDKWRITNYRQLGIEQQSVVQIEAEFSGEWYDNVQVSLLPDKDWAVREFKLHYKTNPGERSFDQGTVEYALHDEKLFPSKVRLIQTTEIEAEKKVYRREWDASIESVVFACDERVFSPSYYGLPDVTTSPEDNSESRLQVFVVAGIVFLTVSLGCGVLWRRKARVK